LKPFMARQGDVLIEQVNTIPADTKPVPRDGGRVILAYGEVTGHAHAILEPSVTLKEQKLAAGIARYLDAPEGATLQHEEHSTLTLPPGQYRVIQQREYSPEAIRNVRD
jgi:hypothetical protein